MQESYMVTIYLIKLKKTLSENKIICDKRDCLTV